MAKINYAEEQNLRCLYLGMHGMSYKLIENQTGLSNSQIGYRLKQTHTQPTPFRNGNGPVASRVLDGMDNAIKIKRTDQFKVRDRLYRNEGIKR